MKWDSIILILSCLVLISSGESNPPTISVIDTNFGFFNATFQWNIKRLQFFDFGTAEEPKILSSPFFKAFDYQDGNKEYKVQFHVSPVYDDGLLRSYEIEADFDPTPQSYTFCYVLNGEWSCLGASPITLDRLTVKNELKFKLKFYLAADYNTNKVLNELHKKYAPTLPYNGDVIPLRNELIQMFDEDESAKFIIESGGEEITAFKPIMRARSSVFKELLSNDTDRLRITDFQPTVIRKMIEFCNNDTIENFEYKEMELFALGYDYKIESLMAFTSRHIASTASVDNAVARFKFGHFYGYEKLKTWFFEYITKNFLEVSKTPAFKTLDPELYKPFLEELLKENKIH